MLCTAKAQEVFPFIWPLYTRAKALQLPPMTVGPYNAIVSGASGIQVLLASSGAGLRCLSRGDLHAACAQASQWSDYVRASCGRLSCRAKLLVL